MNRIFLLIGIINQLTTTRANRTLSELDLPLAQFGLLSHFSHNPEKGWTVTQLAKAMEMNQPAMTKTTQRLLKKGLIEKKQEHSDKRMKTFYIKKEGLKLVAETWKRFNPEFAWIFDDWSKKDLVELERLLERLKIKLDDNREQRS